MAVISHTRVQKAGRIEQQAVDDGVNASIAAQGGPPEGLMALIVYPEGDGFIISSVWNNEDNMLRFDEAVQRPAIEGAQLSAEPTVTSPVWSFARP